MSGIIPVLDNFLNLIVKKRIIDIRKYTFYVVYRKLGSEFSSLVIFAESENVAVLSLIDLIPSFLLISIKRYEEIVQIQELINLNKEKMFELRYMEEFDNFVSFKVVEEYKKENLNCQVSNQEIVHLGFHEANEFLKLFLQVFLLKLENESVCSKSFEEFLSNQSS